MPEIRLLTAEKTRSRLTIQQQRYIKKLYQQAVEDVKDWEKSLQGKDNVSSVIRREYLNQMRKDLNEEMEKIGSDVESTIKSNISATATAVVKDANSVLNGLGVSVKGAYSFVPSDVVQAIIVKESARLCVENAIREAKHCLITPVTTSTFVQ